MQATHLKNSVAFLSALLLAVPGIAHAQSESIFSLLCTGVAFIEEPVGSGNMVRHDGVELKLDLNTKDRMWKRSRDEKWKSMVRVTDSRYQLVDEHHERYGTGTMWVDRIAGRLHQLEYSEMFGDQKFEGDCRKVDYVESPPEPQKKPKF